ncbi:hypothetical protein R6Q59_027049 [Mikania micrantha]
MLLMAKATTIILRVFPNHQIEGQNLLFRPKSVKFQLSFPSRCSQFTSPCFNTISRTRIPASLSLISPANHQNTDYNVEIYRYCKLGNLQKAMDLVCISRETVLDSKTYCNILQPCAESKALHHGKKVHKLISTSGRMDPWLLGGLGKKDYFVIMAEIVLHVFVKSLMVVLVNN